MENFDLSQSIILENERVLLRPLEITDHNNLLGFSLNEPEIWKYSLVQAGGEENLKNYLKIAMEGRNSKKEYPFIVFDKKQNSYAGSTRFYDILLSHKTLQLGYTWYGKNFQGTGLNKHCKFLLLQYAFEVMKMERVEFRADNSNARSIAAMKSIGCKPEGVLRSSMYNIDGVTRRDSIVLSILRKEWFDEVKESLKKQCTAK
ncbi:MAG: GNAT family N-acetyltransferase [Bacteroidetes bacterium]|nr:GNAT family N-acetyltransferase [Bacteroidota bacterium]